MHFIAQTQFKEILKISSNNVSAYTTNECNKKVIGNTYCRINETHLLLVMLNLNTPHLTQKKTKKLEFQDSAQNKETRN